MKPHFKPLATAFAATLQLAALAAVPLAWDARPGNPAPASFDRYHGEALEFRCTFRGFGELPFAPGADIRLWFQTNGMGSAWWSAPATIQSNVLTATWSPALDPGADRVSLFFGAPSNAYAAAVLRLRHSPGFAPGTMPDPETFHESDPVFTAWLAAFSESDPVFSSWLGGYTPPETSLEPSTNYTDRALVAFAETGTVSRARSYGTPTRWVDSTGCVWETPNGWTVYTNGVVAAGWLTYDYSVDHGPEGNYVQLRIRPTEEAEDEGYPVTAANFPEGVTPFWNNDYETLYSYDADLYGLTYGDTIRVKRGETNLVGRVALTNDIPSTLPESDPTVPEWAKEPSPPSYSASDVGAAPASLVQAVTNIQVESALVYRLYSGSNVVAEVTNYNSQVHAPELRLMQLNESNEYVTVWTETNGLARTLATATKYTDVATNALQEVYAPRAWSKTTSGLGANVPDGETWITTPKVYVTGGLEYHQTIDAYGAVWVLCSNGMTPEYSPDTNAYFRISADDGTPIFSIEKTDAMVVGANAAGITVGESSIVIPVPVVSPDPPTMYWRQHLDSGDWADESSPPTGSTVTWTGEAGARVCTISFSGTRPSSLFFRFTFLQPGGVVIRNKAITDLSQGIIVNGTNYVPTVSGNNLIWTKQ